MKHIIILSIAMLSAIAHGAATSNDQVKHDQDKRHSILDAAKIGDLRQIESLIATGTPITIASAHGSMAIHFAAENGHVDLVDRFLGKYGVNPDIRGAHEQTSAHWAARNGHISVLALLKKHGANINALDKLGRSPLFLAVFCKKIETIDYLLDEAGADPFIKSQKSGATVLHLASLNNLIESTAHLLKRKIFAPDIRADNGGTPLHYASDSAECTKLLLEYGCDRDATDLEGCTPLLSAVSTNNAQVIESLLAHGASVSIADKYGTTPLLMAAERGHYNLVATLIASGANINAEAENGLSPILAACQNGYDSIVELLSLAQEMQADSVSQTNNSTPFSSSKA